MKAKRSAPVADGDRRNAKRQPARAGARRSAETPPRTRRPNRDQRPLRSAPATGPTPRPGKGPARPKTASQAKARAKARKAKAPKVVRPPLRERLLIKLASIEVNPRAMLARVPFVVLVIAALGVGLGITLWLSTGSAERSYQLGHARQINQGLLQQKEALERNVLEAQAAPALAEAARNLGMIPSRDTAHLVQDPGGNWIVVGTPKPAEGVPPPPLNTPLPEETTPPPPPPPAPRVVDPRELAVRIPQPGQPATALPGGAPVDAPHVVPGVTPAAPGPVPLAIPPAAQLPPAPLSGPAPAGPAAQFVGPVGPALPQPDAAAPAQPGPTVAVERFSPAVAPIPSA